MKASHLRRVFALMAIVSLIAFAVPALSQTAVQEHRQARKESIRQLRRTRIQHRRNVRQLRQVVSHSRMLLDRRASADPGRWSRIQSWAVDEIRRTQWRLAKQNRSWHRRSRRLAHRARMHTRWLARFAIFEVCPVPGYTVIHDDFGEIVRVNNVEPHVHMGSDVQAPYGTRIVAPFDGRAEASWSEHGGLQVRVYGERGYVYNAHLSRYGRTGFVRAGDTIGYVGSTGLSTAPHDHIEWHPGGGGAVDPYTYLALSCIG